MPVYRVWFDVEVTANTEGEAEDLARELVTQHDYAVFVEVEEI